MTPYCASAQLAVLYFTRRTPLRTFAIWVRLLAMSIETAAGRVPTWTLGELLRKARSDAGLSQDEMARELGVSRRTVTYWETDGIVPRRAMVLAWALRTGVPVWWLEGKENPHPENPDGGDGLPRQDLNLRPSD